MSSFLSTKIFKGFPCTHRQWRADSHCRFVHGYSREFYFEFACNKLTPEMWVVNFGGLKKIRSWLEHYFDHTFLVAQTDPELPRFQQLDQDGIIQLRVLPDTGMEATAKFVYGHINEMIQKETQGRVWVGRVEVRENEHNSGIFIP